MFPAGDEFLNTQYGNNNAYCQDNEISWLDWSMLEKNRDHFEYTKHMIRLRKEHDVIRRFSGTCSLGWPEMRSEGPDESANVLRVIYAGRNRENTGDDLVLLAVNVYWEEQEFPVPGLPYGMGLAGGSGHFRMVSAERYPGRRKGPGIGRQDADRAPFRAGADWRKCMRTAGSGR